MIRGFEQRHRYGGVALLFLSIVLFPIANTNAASLSDQLTELGHPNTKMCSLPNSKHGLGKLMVLQFKKRTSRSENQQESLAILKVIAGALENANQRYFGFAPVKRWDTCRERDPEIIFWRDYDSNWRYMAADPKKYLAQVQEDLEPALRDTPAEAYVLFSLGLVEQRLNQADVSVRHFEKSYEILNKSGDPNGIKAFVSIPLIHHHFSEDGDEAQGQMYLNTFAQEVENVTDETVEYLPLIKVAPVYPAMALRRGVEGYVILEFTVDADGKVQDPVVIEQSPENIFGDAAIEAAKSFRYIPTVHDGVRIPTEGVRNKITFEFQ